jgi:glycerol uptake facilitator-like aquaporin
MMVRTASYSRIPLARAADEFALTTVLLFIAVTLVRWLRDPASPLYIADLNAALAVIGVLSGAILTGLILAPPGRRSGGHMNPAVTVGLWLMDSFPGRNVLPYVLAQLGGSLAGTGLARLLWGPAALSLVRYGAVGPAPAWQSGAVFVAEAGTVILLILVVGFLLAPRSHAVLPYVIGVFVGLVIVFLGPLSGGSINPARQLGPAAFSGQNICLWIYLVAPVAGAVLGALVHRLLIRRPRTREHVLMPGVRTSRSSRQPMASGADPTGAEHGTRRRLRPRPDRAGGQRSRYEQRELTRNHNRTCLDDRPRCHCGTRRAASGRLGSFRDERRVRPPDFEHVGC